MKQSSTRNILTALLLQLLAIANGFILPRIILSYFGSEVNGLLSSISQFLNYIQLLDGGLSGVVMASLYKALAEHDDVKVSRILIAVERFFRKISVIYIGYAVCIAIVYPLLVPTGLSWGSVFSLTLVLASATFIQYFFALTFRTLLNADRQGYVVSIVQIICLLFNLVFALVLVRIYPQIHLLKAVNAIAFIIQPLVFRRFIRKHYVLRKDVEPDHDAIRQRWDGFGQNLAYFIHTNTDVVVLTFFTDLKTVSVYTVYFSVIGSLKNLIMSISTSVSPFWGNTLAKGNKEAIDRFFDMYEFGIGFVTTVAFSCCITLVCPFISIYTSGINDINYLHPVFAVFLSLAEAVYCFCYPHVSVAYSAGHFKETAKYAYTVAISNIAISLILVRRLGLIGVALGTLISMCYEMVVYVFYAKKNIIYRPVRKWFKALCVFLAAGTLSVLVTSRWFCFPNVNYLYWAGNALICGLCTLLIVSVFSLVFYRKTLKALWHGIRFRKEPVQTENQNPQ